VVANHLSNFDIPLLLVAIPRRISFMAQEELFRFPYSPGFRLFESFPVHRGRIDREAFDRAKEALKRKDWALGMFPEGRKSAEAQLQPGRTGTALVALRHDAYLLPVGIAGTEKVKERLNGLRSFLHRPVIKADIGKPFKLPSAAGKLTHAHLELCTDIIMRQVARLLPESYQGVYKLEEHEVPKTTERTHAAVL
jgi:1-acyl-sn-glycerol-3-phosphate acyltransferase